MADTVTDGPIHGCTAVTTGTEDFIIHGVPDGITHGGMAVITDMAMPDTMATAGVVTTVGAGVAITTLITVRPITTGMASTEVTMHTTEADVGTTEGIPWPPIH